MLIYDSHLSFICTSPYTLKWYNERVWYIPIVHVSKAIHVDDVQNRQTVKRISTKQVTGILWLSFYFCKQVHGNHQHAMTNQYTCIQCLRSAFK